MTEAIEIRKDSPLVFLLLLWTMSMDTDQAAGAIQLLIREMARHIFP